MFGFVRGYDKTRGALDYDERQLGRAAKALENLGPDDVRMKDSFADQWYLAGELYKAYSGEYRRAAAGHKSHQIALKNMGLDPSSQVAFHFRVFIHPKALPEQKNGTWWALAGKLTADSFAVWRGGRPREQPLAAAKAYWDHMVTLVRADPRSARQIGGLLRAEPMLSFAKHFGADAKFMAPFLIEELGKHLAGEAAAVGNRDDHLLPAYDALILIAPAGGNGAKKVLQTAQAQEFFDAETTAKYRKAIAEALKKFK